MTKFETILRLAEIKGVIGNTEHPENVLIYRMLSELINKLSKEFHEGECSHCDESFDERDTCDRECEHQDDGSTRSILVNTCRHCGELYR